MAKMVPRERLELSWIAPLVPKTSASTNFATSASAYGLYQEKIGNSSKKMYI
jgi:hypothetical protein